MLTTSLVREINRLLIDGQLSHRQIAMRLNISRGTISAIATGRRGLHGMDAIRTRPARSPTSVPTRCPDCGYRVYLPCLICKARQQRRKQRQKLSETAESLS